MLTKVGQRWLRLQFQHGWLVTASDSGMCCDLVLRAASSAWGEGSRVLARAALSKSDLESELQMTCEAGCVLQSRWLSLTAAQSPDSKICGRLLVVDRWRSVMTAPADFDYHPILPSGIFWFASQNRDVLVVPSFLTVDSAAQAFVEEALQLQSIDNLMLHEGMVRVFDFKDVLTTVVPPSHELASMAGEAAAVLPLILQGSCCEDLFMPYSVLLHWLAVFLASQILRDAIGHPQSHAYLLSICDQSGVVPLPTLRALLGANDSHSHMLFNFVQSWKPWRGSAGNIDCVALLADVLICMDSVATCSPGQKTPKQLQTEAGDDCPSLRGSLEAPSVILEINHALHLPLVLQKCPNTFVSYRWLVSESKGSSCKELGRTDVIYHTTCPAWDHRATLPLPSTVGSGSNERSLLFPAELGSVSLRLSLWHVDTMCSQVQDESSNVLVGVATVSLSPLVTGFEEVDGYFHILAPAPEDLRGQIRLKLRASLASFCTGTGRDSQDSLAPALEACTSLATNAQVQPHLEEVAQSPVEGAPPDFSYLAANLVENLHCAQRPMSVVSGGSLDDARQLEVGSIISEEDGSEGSDGLHDVRAAFEKNMGELAALQQQLLTRIGSSQLGSHKHGAECEKFEQSVGAKPVALGVSSLQVLQQSSAELHHPAPDTCLSKDIGHGNSDGLYEQSSDADRPSSEPPDEPEPAAEEMPRMADPDNVEVEEAAQDDDFQIGSLHCVSTNTVTLSVDTRTGVQQMLCRAAGSQLPRWESHDQQLGHSPKEHSLQGIAACAKDASSDIVGLQVPGRVRSRSGGRGPLPHVLPKSQVESALALAQSQGDADVPTQVMTRESSSMDMVLKTSAGPCSAAGLHDSRTLRLTPHQPKSIGKNSDAACQTAVAAGERALFSFFPSPDVFAIHRPERDTFMMVSATASWEDPASTSCSGAPSLRDTSAETTVLNVSSPQTCSDNKSTLRVDTSNVMSEATTVTPAKRIASARGSKACKQKWSAQLDVETKRLARIMRGSTRADSGDSAGSSTSEGAKKKKREEQTPEPK
eukprot:TRINITY_DN42412_c0_g1_i1.p1 TRINITY_DN42412_c0_g1~~TRINITY_DN42412_c0_g1_i1.p1  ORF type:complete len:1043 (+),score=175.52 TRINITY_DN42412_c0_g1_i1:101-3229(+)